MDNRREVLRLGTAGENASDINRKTTKTTSRHVGISFTTQYKKWKAQIRISSLQCEIGCYETEDDAVM